MKFYYHSYLYICYALYIFLYFIHNASNNFLPFFSVPRTNISPLGECMNWKEAYQNETRKTLKICFMFIRQSCSDAAVMPQRWPVMSSNLAFSS